MNLSPRMHAAVPMPGRESGLIALPAAPFGHRTTSSVVRAVHTVDS
ncbi:MAG TPA: hypothetical protein VN153_00840 [Tahibacter sp.]|nr:hypothetical protein [Tahibacter sp.]